MHFTTSTLALIASLTLAAASPARRATIASIWHVSSFSYDDSSVFYNFTLSGSDTNPEFGGPFSTFCKSNTETLNLLPCENPEFVTRFTEGELQVQRTFLESASHQATVSGVGVARQVGEPAYK